ncbi:PAS domain S-box-containing protein [Rhodoblastus acidophilus]|uniref:PAS domain-containing protein n=1 Tax=Rhodoblastus acidophilus TaxID=1074 RepID=UPI0022250F65|nr:PAS domain-containing protein [Rhodoblastus acidophilus]MCW2286699.1 PAS domain S-box-containing protein [Rhodoblastus acidophilus]MCW2335518.1 PAS domain S-box-containing protein [Rhodoblastus acidophilus]
MPSLFHRTFGMRRADARALVSGTANDEPGTLARNEADRIAEVERLRDYQSAVNAIFHMRKSGLFEFEAGSGRLLSANEHFCQITGWREPELMRRVHSDITHPEDRDHLIEQWRKAAEGAGRADLDVRCVRPDGTIARLRLGMAVCARDAAGRPTRGLALVEDVTDAWEETDRLRANEALLRVTMETGQIGAFDVDLAADRVCCAPQTQALMGLPPGASPVSIATWLSMLMPEDCARAKAQFATASARCLPEVSAHWRVLHSNCGRVRNLEARAQIEYDPDGRPIRSFGVLIDVTSAHEAEAMLRLCLQGDGIGAFRHDWDSGFVECGPEAKAILGLPKNSAPIPAEQWWLLILPEDRQQIQSWIKATATAQAAEGVIGFRIRRPGTGIVRQIEARVRHVYAPNGRRLTTAGVMIDMTVVRHAEELRRLSMEIGSIGVVHRDFVSGMVECSAETRALFGFPRDGKPLTIEQWWAPFLPEDLERMKAEIVEGVEAGDVAVRNATFRIHHVETGELRHFESRVRLDYGPDGSPLSALGVVIDVTAARQAEDLQQLSLEIGGIGTFRHDFVTGKVEFSPEARAIYGVPNDGKSLTIEQLWTPIMREDKARVRARLKTWLAQKGKDVIITFRVRHLKDGGLRHLEARVRREYDAEGRLRSALGVIIDVTTRHEAESRVAYSESARQRLETLGETVGSVAHEVNNLMQPIAGLCELSLLDLPDEAPDRQNWKIVADCARRVTGVMGHILAYGRFATPDVACIPFGPAVCKALDFVCSVSMQWPSIVRELVDEHSCAMIVEDELAQVLLNLIQNATHAHASQIVVSVTRANLHCSDVAPKTSALASSALRLTVVDDGDGMDPNTCDRALLPFFSSKPIGQGTGMGLAVVSGIVKSWSGHLTIDSQLGAGTTVSIIVPVIEDRLLQAARPQAIPPN